MTDWKETDRFKVRYCFINLDTETTDGEYHIDFLDNNGEGFTYEDAVHIARELSLREGVKWASIREITGKNVWDKEDDEETDGFYEPYEDWGYEEDENYTPSATAGDYSPSCPWNAPGMSISDFI